MHGFRSADSGKVAVALVGKHGKLRVGALYACRNGGRSAVGGFDHIAVEIIICKHRAADGRYAHGVALDTELVDDLGNKAVDYPVRAAGAVMERRIGERVRLLEYCHFASPSAYSVIFA